MPDTHDPQPRRRRSDQDGSLSETQAAVRQLVETMEGLAATIAQQGPIIAAFQVHIDEETREKAQREAKDVVEQQQFSVMAYQLGRLVKQANQAETRAAEFRYKGRILLKSVSAACAGAALLLDNNAGGRFTGFSLLSVLAANAALLLLAVLFLWASVGVPHHEDDDDAVTEVAPRP